MKVDGRRPAVDPLWARAEAEQATFEPTRISSGKRAPIRMAALAVAAMVALVAAGGLGRSGDPEPPRLAVATPMPLAQAEKRWLVYRGWPPALPAFTAVQPVRLIHPNPLFGPQIGPTIPIEGTLRLRADRVGIALQTAAFETLTSTIVDTADPHGGVRPVRTPMVDVELELPTPRPRGGFWLVITAYDSMGHPIGQMRQLVHIGARRVS